MTELPQLLKDLPDDGNWDDARAAVPPEPYPDGAVPKVITTDMPSELILFDGEPALAGRARHLAAMGLEHRVGRVLRQGRKAMVRASVGPLVPRAGLERAVDLRDAGPARRLPENSAGRALLCRARVGPGHIGKRRGAAQGQHPDDRARRDGLDHADGRLCGRGPVRADRGDRSRLRDEHERRPSSRSGDRYFLLQDGVWFVADSPNGPWQLAREVPEEIYQIPPSSPLYNATYVRVYETEPDAVWYGYTMGYLYGFLAWGTYVYGTGWAYPPYWYSWPGYGYPIYYPRPVTWGIGAYYNPIRGVYGRYGYAYGPYRGIAAARTWNPRTGTYARGGAAWGPRGIGGFVAAYNPRTDRGGYRGRRTQRLRRLEIGRREARLRVGARDGPDERCRRLERCAGTPRTARASSARGGAATSMPAATATSTATPATAGRSSTAAGRTWRGRSRGELLERGEGLRDLSPEARDRLQERGGGEAVRNLAGAGAAGAAGAALGQRLNQSGGSGGADRRTNNAAAGADRRAERTPGQRADRAADRPTERPAAAQPPTQKPAAAQRPAQRQSVSRPSPSPSRPLPSNSEP